MRALTDPTRRDLLREMAVRGMAVRGLRIAVGRAAGLTGALGAAGCADAQRSSADIAALDDKVIGIGFVR